MVDWKSNKMVGVLAVIVIALGVYLIVRGMKKPQPRKMMPYICIHPEHQKKDGGIVWLNKYSKFWQENWLSRGNKAGPCPEGHGNTLYSACVCAECRHVYLEMRSSAPPEFKYPECPRCRERKEREKEVEKAAEVTEEGGE